MRIPKSAFLLMGLCVLLSLTCQPEIELLGDIPEPTIVGHHWSRGRPAHTFLFLEHDYSYELRSAGLHFTEPSEVYGNYSVHNDQISFSDEAGAEACSENPGVYKFELRGGLFEFNVTFTLVSDACSRRPPKISGLWN